MTSSILCTALASASVLASAWAGTAAAAPARILFSNAHTSGGALRAGESPAGPIAVSGGVTQVALPHGGIAAFVGDADFSIADDGVLTIRSGHVTAGAGAVAGEIVRTAGGAEVRLARAGAASVAIGVDGAITGRSLAGTIAIAAGEQVRSFKSGQAFRAAAGAAASAAVTAGAQPVSGGTLIDQPTTLAQVLNNAALVPLLVGATSVPVVQNPALGTVKSGSAAELLATYLGQSGNAFALGQSRAILEAQLAFLRAGGAAGALDGARAAAALADYVRFLQSGGTAASYSAASDALLRSYLALLVAAGLPSGLDSTTTELVTSYIKYLTEGGTFGTVPVATTPPTTTPPTTTPPTTPPPTTNPPTTTPTPAATRTLAAAPSGLYSGGPSDANVLAIGVDAQGAPVDLGFYGTPGTATLTDYKTGSGWTLGRFGGGTFGSGSNARTYEANQGAHFALLTPVTNLPTSGGVLYAVTAATTPTFTAENAPAVTASTLTLNLGVLFGSSPKFGYDGTLSVTAAGQTSSIAFSTAGGSAAPALANVDNSNPRFGLYGTAPLTQATGTLCASASACSFKANFIAGGEAAANFGVGYGVVATPGGTSLLDGAAILGKSGTIATTPPVPVVTFENVPGTRTTNQFLVRVDPKNAIASSGPVTTVVDAQGLAAYRKNSTTAESPQRGTATGGETGSADGVIGWTRWAGGTPAGDFNGSGPATLGANQGWHFVYGTAATAVPTTGIATYTLAGATKPTIVDGSLAPGAFSGSAAVAFGTQARLGLDFTVTIGGVAYRSTTTGGTTTPATSDITISSGAFEYFGTGLPTTGTGAACPNGTCRAGVIGMLAGSGASHLGFDYLISEPSAAGLRTSISGAAAFKRDATAVVTPIGTGTAPSGAALVYSAQGKGFNRSAITATIVASPEGQLTSATTTSAETFSKNDATVAEYGGAAGVVGWSRWSGGTVTAGNVATALTANQGAHSAWGMPVSNMPTAGSATYDLVGATKPTIGDGSEAPGTFTGSLAVSFAAMKVGWESTIALGGTNYVFNSSGGLAAPSVTLGSDGRWIGSSATVNGTQGRAYGFLAGNGASHAGMTYFLVTTPSGGDAKTITGAATFVKH